MSKKANGEGSIYYHEKRKRWMAQCTIGLTADGKPKRKTFYGKTKKEVREKMIEAQMEVKHGRYVEPSKITVATLMKELVDEDKELNLIKESTYLRKVSSVKKVEDSVLGDKVIQDVTESDIKAFLKTMTSYSNSVISKLFELLKRTMNEAVKRDIIIKNPIYLMNCPKSSQPNVKVRALTLAEHQNLNRVLTETDCNYSTQMRLMLLTGMRMGEINALDINDVNFDFRTITIRRTLTRDGNDRFVIGETTKTYAGIRKIPMDAQVFRLLKNYIDTKYIENKDYLLFYDNRSNKPIATSQVNSQLTRIFKKYNIIDETQAGKVSLHSLRHSYATRCIEAGLPPKILQTLLGHTDIKVTLNTYCDAFDEFKTESLKIVEQYMKDKKII